MLQPASLMHASKSISTYHADTWSIDICSIRTYNDVTLYFIYSQRISIYQAFTACFNDEKQISLYITMEHYALFLHTASAYTTLIKHASLMHATSACAMMTYCASYIGIQHHLIPHWYVFHWYVQQQQTTWWHSMPHLYMWYLCTGLAAEVTEIDKNARIATNPFQSYHLQTSHWGINSTVATYPIL